jgi:hypothetical protein
MAARGNSGRWRSRVSKDCSNPVWASRLACEPRGDCHTASKESCPRSQEFAVPAKSGVQATIALKHLTAALSDSHALPKKQAEAVLGRSSDADHSPPEEGRQNPPDRPRHPSGAEAGGQDGSKPCNRRGHQNQGEQKDCLSASRRTQRGGVALPALRPAVIRSTAGMATRSRLTDAKG